MQNQEPGNNLFCIYRDCEDLALFGDYCKAHQFQRAEAAEADNAGLRGTLRDEILRAEAAEARIAILEHDLEVDDWHTAFVRAEAERDELRVRLEQAQRDLAEYRTEIERLTRKAMTA